MSKCEFCSKEFKPLGVASHTRSCVLNPNKVSSNIERYTRVHGSWRKGLTKSNDERIRKNSENLSKTLIRQVASSDFKIRRPGNLAREATSQRQSLQNSGGRSKWFDVGGIKVQGTWEYSIALKLNELFIKWLRPNSVYFIFKYELDGKMRSYTPDFYLPEFDVYLEIKGHWWGNDRLKMDTVIQKYPTHKFIIVEKQDYLECLTISA